MSKSRLVIAIILLLTVLTSWDVYANRSAVFDGWVEGFNVEARPWQGEVKEAFRDGRESTAASGIEMVIIKTNQGSVKVRGADTQEVTAAYRLKVGARTEQQASGYLDRLAVSIAPGAGTEGQLVVDFTEPNVRPTYIGTVAAELEVTVPEGVSVLVDGISSVDVEGIDGHANIVSVGPTRVADVGGDASVTARPGPGATVLIDPETGLVEGNPVSITDVGGNLDLSATMCMARVEGINGGMKARVTDGKLDATGVGGAINLIEQMAVITLAGPIGRLDADCAGGSLHATGVGGAVNLRGWMTFFKLQLAREASYRVDATLEMSGLFTDYQLETSGDARMQSRVTGQIGSGANELKVTLEGGTLEIRRP